MATEFTPSSLADRKAVADAGDNADRETAQSAISALQAQVSKVTNDRDRAIANRRAAFEAVTAARGRWVASEAHAELTPFARKLVEDPDRPTAQAFAEAARRHDSAHRRELGDRSSRGVAMGGFGHRLAIIVASIHVERDPGALSSVVGVFARNAVSGFHGVVSALNTTIINGEPVVSVLRTLAGLEHAIVEASRQNRGEWPADDRRWQAIVEAPSVDVAAFEIAEIDREVARQRTEVAFAEIGKREDAERDLARRENRTPSIGGRLLS